MPTPIIYNKHICSCGIPFSSYRLLNSHYQKFQNHRMVDTDIVMEEAEDSTSSDDIRKLYPYINILIFPLPNLNEYLIYNLLIV